MLEWVHFINPSTSDADRIEQLRRSGVRYVVFTQKIEGGIASPNDPQLLSFFKQVRDQGKVPGSPAPVFSQQPLDQVTHGHFVRILSGRRGLILRFRHLDSFLSLKHLGLLHGSLRPALAGQITQAPSCDPLFSNRSGSLLAN